jgi:hypothetical protein
MRIAVGPTRFGVRSLRIGERPFQLLPGVSHSVPPHIDHIRHCLRARGEPIPRAIDPVGEFIAEVINHVPHAATGTTDLPA